MSKHKLGPGLVYFTGGKFVYCIDTINFITPKWNKAHFTQKFLLAYPSGVSPFICNPELDLTSAYPIKYGPKGSVPIHQT